MTEVPTYRNLLDQITGGHISSKIAEGVCVICHGEAKQFNDALSEKEHQQSGLCQHCQDDFFEDEDEETPDSNYGSSSHY